MMAQVLHMETHFPGKSIPNSLSGIKEPEAPYSVETPYGYRLDLDFLKYVDDIEKGHTIKRVPVSRRPRFGSLPRGPGYTGSWWTSTESLCSNASNDSRHSSYSYCGRGFYPAYEVRSGSQTSSSFNPRVERTLLDASKKLEAGQSRPLSLGCRSSSNLSTTSLSRLPSSSSCQQLSFTPLSSGMSTPVSPTPVHLQHVREQMAVALKRLRQLEEQVKMIPVLQVKISVLQEEKRQLSVQLKSQKYLGHPGGSTKGKTRGELYIEIPEEESKDGRNESGSGEGAKVSDEGTERQDRKEAEDQKEQLGTESKKECLASNGRPVKKFCSVGVWVREVDLMPHGPSRPLEADKQKFLVQALSAKVAVLERQLSRALTEVQNANRKLEEAERASRGEDTLKREKKEDVRADAVKVARVERGSEVVSSTEVGPGVQPQRSRDLEGRGVGSLKTREEEDRVYKSREVMEKPLFTSTGPPVHVHLVKKISITGQNVVEKKGLDEGNQKEEMTPCPAVNPNIQGTECTAGGSVSGKEDGTGFLVKGMTQDGQEIKSQCSGINGEMDTASSEDSGTMENPSDSESTESEYHEASEGLTSPQVDIQAPLTSIGPPKETPEPPAPGSSPTSPVPRVELSNVLISGCVALQKSLDEPTALSDAEKAAAHEAVVKEWMKIFRQKEVEPAIIRHHLNVFRAMSPRLLEVIVNMADTKGNTAVHYAVSQSNFTVVRQLLDTGLCDVNRQNKAGFTPLMLTALAAFRSNEDIETVTQMLRLGDVNCRASQAGQTALMLAVSHGRLDVVRALLQCGADVNVQDHDGSTALMCACEHGHVDIVSLLLAVPNCDMTLTDHDGSTALSIALEAGQNDIAMLLYAHDAKTSAAVSYYQGVEKNLKNQGANPSDESQ
ncbi:KN motif and ankyrin repeat domain-containing protein 2 isoform X3 [Engystomops pustulosus]